jgi:hypothetical protein
MSKIEEEDVRETMKGPAGDYIVSFEGLYDC